MKLTRFRLRPIRVSLQYLLIVFALVCSVLALAVSLVRRDTSELRLSIAIPIDTHTFESDGTQIRRILVDSEDNYFYVTLTNASDIRQIVSEEWCEWGYFNLFFELVDDSGRVVYTIEKRDRAWSENWHDYSIVKPGEVYVRAVSLTNDIWDVPTSDDLPNGTYVHFEERWRIQREKMRVRMRAVYSGDGIVLRSETDDYEFIYPATDW